MLRATIQAAALTAVLTLSACGAPAAPGTEATVAVPAETPDVATPEPAPTSAATATVTEPAVEPTAAPAEPTTAPTSAPATEPTAEPTQEPAATATAPAEDAATHVVVYDFTGERPGFRWVPASTVGLGDTVAGRATLIPSPLIGDVQVVGDRAYFAEEGRVVEAAPDGTRTPLEFTLFETEQPGIFRPFLVSPSGTQIAWVDARFYEGPGTQFNVLKVANIDGSNLRILAETGMDETAWLQPLGWNEAAGLLSVGRVPVWHEAQAARDFAGSFDLVTIDLNTPGTGGELPAADASCGERACVLGVAPSGMQFAQVEYGEDGTAARLIVGDTAPGGAMIWELPGGLRSIGNPVWLEQPGLLAVKALTADERYQILVADLQANDLAVWWEGEADVTPRLFAGPEQLLAVGAFDGPRMGAPLDTLLVTPGGAVEPVAREQMIMGSGTTE